MSGTLFVVATPIGNLEDITYRATRLLSEVNLIAAEDTRQTRILLDRYQIKTPMTSYHKFNIKGKTGYLVDLLKQGKNIALVSDSGMPGISDPGYELIKEAVVEGVRVEPIPGPSAAITALAVSGLPTERFIFEGFLPKKPGKKRKALSKLQDEAATIIFYESPFRIIKTLEDVLTALGDRQVAVCREMTKKFEEIIRGPINELIKQEYKGEVTVVIK